MKFLKYSVLALALAAGFSSCSDDPGYVPGEASPGVYFPTDDALEVTLDRHADAFDVTVSRMGETAAATYSLVGEADPEVFTLPTSVSFANGETTTTVSVAYNKDAMKLDAPYDVFLAFAEGAQLSSYGYPELEMSVTLPAPWKSIGMGQYRDLWLLALTKLSQEEDFNPVWEVELQQHEVDPTRFRWVHPYGENFAKYVSTTDLGALDASEYDSKNQYYVEFICDPQYGLAVIPEQSLGFQFFSDGVMVVLNDAGRYLAQNSYETIVKNAPEACTRVNFGKAKVTNENGEEEEIETITSVFAPDKVNLCGFEGDDGLYYGDGGYQWVRAGVEIKDYDLSISYKGVLTTPDEITNVMADVTLGADIVKAKAGMVRVEDETVTEESTISGVIDGTVPSKTVEDKKATLQFTFEGGGQFIIALVGYNAKDEVVNSTALSFEVIDNSQPKQWKKVGTGLYTDMFVLPVFGARDISWPVDVQQNTEDPTLYRWVHPYGATFKEVTDQLFQDPWEADMYDSANALYMNFVVKDGLVAVPMQFTGVIPNSTIKRLSAANEAGMYYAMGWSFDNILGHPQLGEGKFSTATFDGETLTSVVQPAGITCLNFEDDDNGSYHTLKDDTGGVQWESSAMSAAPAKMPSLRAANISGNVEFTATKRVLKNCRQRAGKFLKTF